MKEFVPFLLQHWILISLFLIVLYLIIFYEMKERVSLLKKVTAQELVQWVNDKNAVIIDLREKEYFSGGHITNAKNLPISVLKTNPTLLNEYKNKPIIFISDDGAISLNLMRWFNQHQISYSHFMTLGGGMRAWKEAGLPLVN